MIKRLAITDFKSIRDQTIDFDPVTVLVGRSGTGKSNIVQAIRFLRNYLIAAEQAVAVEGGWQRVVPAAVEQPAVTFDVAFDIAGMDEEYRFRLAFGLQQGQQRFQQNAQLIAIDERLTLGSRTLYHRVLSGHSWNWASPPSVVTEISPQGDLVIRRLPALQEVVYAYTALSTGIGYYNLPTSILGISGPQGHPREQQVIQHLTGLKDDASNYLQVMREIIQDLHQPQVRKAITAALRYVNPSVVSIELDSIVQPTVAVVGHALGAKTLGLGLEQESDGFRRFYAHLLALYQRPPKLVNVFEEPENGIYPGALSLLADEFRAAPASGRGQVIMTTHSPGLLDHFSVEDLRVVDMKDGQTIVGPVAPEQQQAVRENLLTTGELLTVDMARIAEPESSRT